MSVAWIRERYGNEGTRDEETGGYTRLFWLYVTDPQNDREVSIINDPLVLPLITATSWTAGADTDSTVRVAGFRLQSIDTHPHLYELEIRYRSPSVEDSGGGASGQDPELDPPEIEYTWASGKRAIQAVFEDTLTENPDLTPEQQVGLS